jgi:hypothetical protein
MTATGVVALLQIALVAYLPGAALYRLPFWQRERRAGLDAEERVFWHVTLSISWSLTVVLALAALSQYRFTLLLGINAGVTLVMLLLSGRRLSYAGTARRPTWTMVIPIGLIVLGCWRFFPVFEYIIGGKDPGVYVNEGIQIAQRGSLVVRDATVAGVPEFGRPLFFPPHYNEDYYSNKFMGMFVRDPDQGTVIGQFPQLYPASIAIGYGIHGLTGGREVVAYWALLGVLSVYFMTARWAGRLPATAAAVLLTLHVAQVWFARYPNSEMAMQAALFASFLAFARAIQDDDRFFAPIVAWLLTLQLFSRVEGLLAILVVAGVAVLSWLAVPDRKLRWAMLLPLAAGTWLGLQYLTTLMAAYFWRPMEFLGKLPRVPMQAGIVLGLVAIGVMAFRREKTAPLLKGWLPAIVAAAVTGLAVYAYFFREPGGKLTDWNAYALRNFVDLYLWWPMAVAAVAGIILAIRQDFWRAPAFILTWTAFSVFLLYKLQIVPEHFWLARRFLPIILPGALVLACAALFGRGLTSERTSMGIVRTVAALIIVTLVGSRYVAAAAPVLPHVEYRNLIPYVERLAERFGERDLIIMESRDAGSDVHVLGLPLSYIYAKSVLALSSAKPDRLRLQYFLEDALKRYDRVFYVGTGGTTLLSREIMATPVDSDRVQVDEFEVTTDRLPVRARRKEFDYGVYQLALGRSAAGPFMLDVGVRDDLHVLRFHAKERSEDRTIRWTMAGSEVAVMGLAGTEREVTLVMSDGGRPASATPARVRVLFNGTLIGEASVGAGFAPYRFAIPAELVEAAGKDVLPAALRLESTTWSPGAEARDTRQLGVMLDTVTVR